MTGIVIVGAGQAGASLAARLRTLGYGGDLTLIGNEPVPPYQRPPLSKAYLLGEIEAERLYLRSTSFWTEQNISLRLGAEVTRIDRHRKRIHFNDETLGYDQLALAIGSQPRRLHAAMGGDLPGVFTLRTLADVDAIAPEFRKGRRLLIVGGGYIGLEAAAVGAKLGLLVTLIEMAPRILNRVAAQETSDYFRRLHTDHAVRILENTGLDRLIGEGHVTGAALSDGRYLDVDLVIVGIGITPITLLAKESGLYIENGIRTDATGRTSDQSIWAAGDCASFPGQDGQVRLESVGNAIDQAEAVAQNMLGAMTPYHPKPWFWSDQYDVKLQIAGLNTGSDRIVTRGEGKSISFWYYKGDTLIAVDALNDARAYMLGKRLIESGKSPDPAVIGDPTADLRIFFL